MHTKALKLIFVLFRGCQITAVQEAAKSAETEEFKIRASLDSNVVQVKYNKEIKLSLSLTLPAYETAVLHLPFKIPYSYGCPALSSYPLKPVDADFTDRKGIQDAQYVICTVPCWVLPT